MANLAGENRWLACGRLVSRWRLWMLCLWNGGVEQLRVKTLERRERRGASLQLN
jgi:hypothetical protein